MLRCQHAESAQRQQIQQSARHDAPDRTAHSCCFCFQRRDHLNQLTPAATWFFAKLAHCLSPVAGLLKNRATKYIWHLPKSGKHSSQLPFRLTLPADEWRDEIMSHILSLIEEQVRSANLRNRPEEHISQPGRYVTKEGVAFGPCLLVSRECGGGGSALAQKAGERLGWNVFDHKIVDEIAQSTHVEQRLVKSVDEHIHSYWEQAWRGILLDDLAEERYFRHLKQIIITLGHQGNVVIVGRGAQFFLPPQGALRVRLVAPLEERVKRVAELTKLPPEQARLKIEQTDKERAFFCSKIFKIDGALPIYYDLIINTGQIDLEGATDLVLMALEKKLGVHLKKVNGSRH